MNVVAYCSVVVFENECIGRNAVFSKSREGVIGTLYSSPLEKKGELRGGGGVLLQRQLFQLNS